MRASRSEWRGESRGASSEEEEEESDSNKEWDYGDDESSIEERERR